MTEKPSFPQIPRPVWWGVRAIIRRNAGIKLDEAVLAAELNVQPAASRQYLTELKRVGLLTEDGAATPLAMTWRMDETYRDAADDILRLAYPDSLIQMAPPGGADRGKVENWFMMQGLGEGTARNKAATYMMIANDDPASAGDTRAAATPQQRNVQPRNRARESISSPREEARPRSRGQASDILPLNINVQVHISAEASPDQIEMIFASMRKHLYANSDT